MRASRATLERYKTDGIFACRLAGSGSSQVFGKDFLEIDELLGSIYFLVLMACARIRPLLRRLSGPSCGGLARFIRWPSGKCSCDKVVFKISHFQERFSIWYLNQKRINSCDSIFAFDLSFKS